MDKKKIDIIAILSFAVIFVLFYSVFIKDDISLYSSLRNKRSSLESTMNRDMSLIETQKNKKSDVIALENEIRDNKDLLYEDDKIPYFLNYVSSLASRHRVGILSIEPAEVIEGEIFTKSVFTAVINGGFSDIYNFLYHMEDDWKAVKVERLLMEKNPSDKRINAKLTVAVLSI